MKTTVIHKNENCGFIKNEKKNSEPPRILSEKTRTMKFMNRPKIISGMTVVGKKEGMGVLGENFDFIQTDAKWKEKSFEKGEVKFLETSVRGAIKKSGLKENEIDLFLSGDLLNQLVSSSFVARDFPVSYFGLYSACSTMTQALAIGAAFANANYFNNIACATSSHFATAERQYRYPLEYGCQRPPYAQWTATAAGCSIVSLKGEGPSITHATVGKVVDFGINDLNNMGAAMAPAAVDTFLSVMEDTGYEPENFDLILSGDLGKLGSDIFRDLMREKGYGLGNNYHDCGAMLYAVDQSCYGGGSGAGCCAAVLNSFVLNRMNAGKLGRVLVLATGALMSPTTSFQGDTIPAISHAVILENDNREENDGLS